MSCRSFLLLITVLATGASAGAIAMSAPDLSGKRFTITWNEKNGTQTRTFLVIFVEGKPGAPVTAMLLNPTEQDLEACPDHTYMGTYSADGVIEMMLKPCKGNWINGFTLTVSGTSLSGVYVGGVSGFGVTGPASGKCENCSAGSTNWTLPGILVVAAVFIMLVRKRKKAKSRGRSTGVSGPVPEDPNDPWHDLRRTQEPPKRIIPPDRPGSKPPSRITPAGRTESKPQTRASPSRGSAPDGKPRR